VSLKQQMGEFRI